MTCLSPLIHRFSAAAVSCSKGSRPRATWVGPPAAPCSARRAASHQKGSVIGAAQGGRDTRAYRAKSHGWKLRFFPCRVVYPLLLVSSVRWLFQSTHSSLHSGRLYAHVRSRFALSSLVRHATAMFSSLPANCLGEEDTCVSDLSSLYLCQCKSILFFEFIPAQEKSMPCEIDVQVGNWHLFTSFCYG